ncbi:MAG: hypothetical protein ACPIOQ_83165, partial [Promethearchaeia archaeon]
CTHDNVLVTGGQVCLCVRLHHSGLSVQVHLSVQTRVSACGEREHVPRASSASVLPHVSQLHVSMLVQVLQGKTSVDLDSFLQRFSRHYPQRPRHARHALFETEALVESFSQVALADVHAYVGTVPQSAAFGFRCLAQVDVCMGSGGRVGRDAMWRIDAYTGVNCF